MFLNCLSAEELNGYNPKRMMTYGSHYQVMQKQGAAPASYSGKPACLGADFLRALLNTRTTVSPYILLLFLSLFHYGIETDSDTLIPHKRATF